VGRSHYVTLLNEVLPRALLAQLGLSKLLLGASGGGGFLLVLTTESLPLAEEFLHAAAIGIAGVSGERLRLVWASTENLGDWTIVRKRLSEAMWTRVHANSEGLHAAAGTGDDAYFTEYMAPRVREVQSVGWPADSRAKVLLGEGEHSWPLGSGAEAIAIARHTALTEDGSWAADTASLASLAQGRHVWGVLRGDVDYFGVRLKRLASIDQHIELSVLYKQFFAGELEVACSQPEYWRRVTILYSGGDDFAVYGSWDALVMLAREIQRLFHRFCETNLTGHDGLEGKTITMAIALAPETHAPFAFVYEEAGRALEAAKSADKDCINIFGKTIEWRHLNHASDLKELMLRMVREFDCPPEFLEELSGFYREKPGAAVREERVWRYHRRLALAIGPVHREREVQRLQKALITDLVGHSATQIKLRPAGRVAVEWARLLIES
jgi:CRISPR-associated protein Csm1